MKFGQTATNRTVTQIFGIVDAEPMPLGYLKKPVVPTSVDITHDWRTDGRRNTSITIYGFEVLASGKRGTLLKSHTYRDGLGSDLHKVPHEIVSLAARIAPWVKGRA